MKKNKMSQYVFVIIDQLQSQSDIIKTIMYEGEIYAKGEICFYSPYKELCSSFKVKYPERAMWGIGFSLSALKKVKLDNSQELTVIDVIDNQTDRELEYFKVKTKILNFSELNYEKDDVFVVVPTKEDREGLCFHGYAEGTEYKLWWCKGLWNNGCGTLSDEGISKYLYDNRFYRDKAIKKDLMTLEKLFPTNKLLDDNKELHDYKLLNLSPGELHEGVKEEKEVKQIKLF